MRSGRLTPTAHRPQPAYVRYHLVTLGCAKNTVDSMRLERALRNARHAPVDAPDDADLVLVNTCGFIDAAKQESIEVVSELDRNRPRTSGSTSWGA